MLERAHVVVDLREVLGQLRVARAQVLARGGDDRWVEPEPAGNLECQAAAGAAIDQLIRSARTSSASNPNAALATPSVVEA